MTPSNNVYKVRDSSAGAKNSEQLRFPPLSESIFSFDPQSSLGQK